MELKKIVKASWMTIVIGVLSILISSYVTPMLAFASRSSTGRGFLEYYGSIMMNHPQYCLGQFLGYGGLLLVAAAMAGFVTAGIVRLVRESGDT